MSVDSVITQITGFKEDLTTDEFELIKTILDKVKYRQNDCDFEIIDDDFNKEINIDETNNNTKFDKQFDSMFVFVDVSLRQYLETFLINKNKKQFYDDFPIIDFLFNKTKLFKPFTDKIIIKPYDTIQVTDNIKFLLALVSKAIGKILKSCITLAIYNYLIFNYKFCVSSAKFKSVMFAKLKGMIMDDDDYKAIEYTANRLGNKHIFKIWSDQMEEFDQKTTHILN
jgi:hypothetical protein